MTIITFDPAAFRIDFPAFADTAVFPDATLQSYFDSATCQIGTTVSGCLTVECRTRALYLMTAHLARLAGDIAAGKTGVIITSGSIDSVSVGLDPPPFGTNQWSWWLNTSPYGQELAALLSVTSAGGLYLFGRPERSAFRKVGGRF